MELINATTITWRMMDGTSITEIDWNQYSELRTTWSSRRGMVGRDRVIKAPWIIRWMRGCIMNGDVSGFWVETLPCFMPHLCFSWSWEVLLFSFLFYWWFCLLGSPLAGRAPFFFFFFLLKKWGWQLKGHQKRKNKNKRKKLKRRKMGNPKSILFLAPHLFIALLFFFYYFFFVVNYGEGQMYKLVGKVRYTLPYSWN